jgi:hypothetical protein
MMIPPSSDAAGHASRPGQWVLLAYRLPREPSRPRIAVWRKLERHGVARLGDGLVALPADARTREQVGWLADKITEAGGTASVWLSVPATLAQERGIAAGSSAARAVEYRAVTAEAQAAASAAGAERIRVVRRLRGELRRIARRDFFSPPERDTARTAVQALAAAADGDVTDGDVTESDRTDSDCVEEDV